jgi:hypothetical protein
MKKLWEIKGLLLSLLLVTIVGCNGGGGGSSESDDTSDANPCSLVENLNNPECKKDIPNIEESLSEVKLEFKDSVFYYDREKSFVTLSKNSLSVGQVNVNSLPVLSEFLNITKDDAAVIVANALDQSEKPESYTLSEYSRIPYLEVAYEPGVNYNYQYIKRDLEGNPQVTTTGSFIVKNNRAYLPLVNDMFGGNFYSENENVGDIFNHELKIIAEGNGKTSESAINLSFKSALEFPETEYTVSYSDEVKDLELANRFNFYYKDADGSNNTNAPFFTLKEEGEPEVRPVDLEIIFKEIPRLELRQEVFFENPINITAVQSGSSRFEEVVSRGSEFYVKNVNLDSVNHFNMKVNINGNEVSFEEDERTLKVSSFPAGANWDIAFSYNFIANTKFTNSLGLITPLKPTCLIENGGGIFTPLSSAIQKKNIFDGEGFYSECHPVTNKKESLTKEEIADSTIEKTDAFFDFFNYIPLNQAKQEVGHFNGIKRVTFYMEGCFKVKVFDGESTREVSKSSVECEDPNNEDEKWTYFKASKTMDISDGVYSAPGISALIEALNKANSSVTSQYKFNGVLNDTNHIY